jgi:alkylated DNA repair dioxygenase AlkB
VPSGRRVLQPRLIAWAGDPDYRYSGPTLEMRFSTRVITALVERVNEHTRVLTNHVLVNRYRDGADSIGFHAPAEPELGRDPIVGA